MKHVKLRFKDIILLVGKYLNEITHGIYPESSRRHKLQLWCILVHRQQQHYRNTHSPHHCHRHKHHVHKRHRMALDLPIRKIQNHTYIICVVINICESFSNPWPYRFLQSLQQSLTTHALLTLAIVHGLGLFVQSRLWQCCFLKNSGGAVLPYLLPPCLLSLLVRSHPAPFSQITVGKDGLRGEFMLL